MSIYKYVSATCAISGTNKTMAVHHPEIMEMVRKSESRVIIRCKFQIWNQISHIDNLFFCIRCQIFNYLINKLTPHGRTKIQKKSTIVTTNISHFIFSAITIVV